MKLPIVMRALHNVVPGLVPGTYPSRRPDGVGAPLRVGPRIKSAGDDVWSVSP
jgi:hypothetical protein